MIEINLVHSKKGFGAQKASASVDLTQINSKMVFIAIAILYVPGFFLNDFFDSQKAQINAEIQVINVENQKALKELKEVQSLQQQVEQHQEQEKRLKAKLEIVREIISSRKNPYQILLYISKNIPENVWLNELKVEKNQLILKGTAKSYKSIGVFTNNLKNAIFFSFVTYRQVTDGNVVSSAKRVNSEFSENFEIVANIARYE